MVFTWVHFATGRETGRYFLETGRYFGFVVMWALWLVTVSK